MRADEVTVVGEGRLGTDVRTVELQRGDLKGERMATARVACHVPKTGSGSGGGTEAVWVRLVAVGAKAEGLEGKGKGDRVAFRGALQWNVYRRKDGTDSTSLECAAEAVAGTREELEGAPRRQTPDGFKDVPGSELIWDEAKETWEQYVDRIARMDEAAAGAEKEPKGA